MKLTQKLLGMLHRVFDYDPERFLALRINYDGTGLKWSVSECVLTTAVTGGSGVNLSINLLNYTLRELVDFIAAQPGYSVISLATSQNRSLAARVLIDGSGDIALSNGDHLYAYSSLTWVYLESVGAELCLAKSQIPEAIRQMAITTAESEWLDELGAYYGVPRQQSELDTSYGPRIIAEVVRPRSNNVAMEAAISYYTGQTTKVTDVIEYGDAFPLYNGAVSHNSAYRYQAQAAPRYGLFDVQYGYDLLGGDDQSSFAHRIRTIIDRLRAAGTHLRSLSLQTPSISDEFTAPTDGALSWVVSPALTDALTAPSDLFASVAAMSSFEDSFAGAMDSTSTTIAYNYRYNSMRKRDGTIQYMGGMTVVE